MPLHCFTIRAEVDPSKPVDAYVEALGAAGCTDALIGTGTPGVIALDFSHEAVSQISAVVSAVKQVESAIPDALACTLIANPD